MLHKRRQLFHWVSKHEQIDERTRRRAECFYCIRVFRNPNEDEARVYRMASRKGLIY